MIACHRAAIACHVSLGYSSVIIWSRAAAQFAMIGAQKSGQERNAGF